jgi:hypothetical protein
MGLKPVGASVLDAHLLAGGFKKMFSRTRVSVPSGFEYQHPAPCNGTRTPTTTTPG